MNRTRNYIQNSNGLIQFFSNCAIVLVIIVATGMLNGTAFGMPGFGSSNKSLNGPWELFVQMGFEGEGLRFPVKVEDENKAQKLDDVFPVLGRPINIKLVQYLPDLKWETAAVEDANGGIVAKLIVKGENLEQDVWLSSADPAKQSISSRIGGVKLKKLNNANGIEELLREITDTTVGIVTVWSEDTGPPVEYVVGRAGTINVPKSKYRVKVLDFLPHYSIDTETKKIINRSDKPVNPALKVSVSDGENSYEQWLWSRFPSHSHTEKKFPLCIEFTYFDFNIPAGRYILVTARGAEPWLFFTKEGKIQLEKAVLGQPYPFTNESYFFTVESIFDSAVIETDWKNNSEQLQNPAIVAAIEQNNAEERIVLELHKPFHYKTAAGTMILIYEPQADDSKISN
ncbi:MAG: hypothetical protein ACYS1A_01300 [Planctomycetota bacterium]|jgi:hypothetical protein